MIQFSDASRKVECLDVHSLQMKYEEIRPVSDITESEARDFWNDVFSSPMDVRKFTEEDIQRDVYGRAEEEFDFDFDASSLDIRQILARFNIESWRLLTDFEKENMCKELMNIIATKLEIWNRPELEFYESDPCDCGAFNPDSNIISINKNNFDVPEEIVDTIAHEMRHAYQFQRAMNPESYMDLLYAYNFANYITPYMDEDGYVNFIDYQDQLIEAEARAFASMFRLEDA